MYHLFGMLLVKKVNGTSMRGLAFSNVEFKWNICLCSLPRKRSRIYLLQAVPCALSSCSWNGNS